MRNHIVRIQNAVRKPVVNFKKDRLVRQLIAAQFKAAGATEPRIRVSSENGPNAHSDAIIERDGQSFEIHLSKKLPLEGLNFYGPRLAAYLHWFSAASPDIKTISVSLSDGHEPTDADYRFSTTKTRGVALPDPIFFSTRGYHRIGHLAQKTNISWEDRSDDIVWRGNLNNVGLFSLDPTFKNNPGVMQRLRFVLLAKERGLDFRFAESPHLQNSNLLASAGLTASFVPPVEWATKKFALDIDGYSNAWNNFMQRLKLGCCVLKVDSPFGFYQWYYPQLKPWEHYIPIAADLSDLEEKIDWARSNSRKSATIAMAGQKVAASLTLESETRVAAELINHHELG